MHNSNVFAIGKLCSFLIIISISNSYAQYNYGLEICEQDAKIEGNLNLDSDNLNLFIGTDAGINNSTSVSNANHGTRNTYMGFSSGKNNTTGYRNTFIGNLTGFQNTTGWENTFIGAFSGNDNTSGFNNLFVGSNSGRNTTAGFQNTFIGQSSGFTNETGSDNTFIGNAAGQSNSSGSRNVYMGQWAGRMNQTGAGNVFLGYRAGSNELGSNKLYIENSDSATPLIYGEFDSNEVTVNGNLCYTGTLNACSDKRYKKNISSIVNPLKNLEKINGVTHEWKHNEFPDKVWKQGVEYGIIAQEVRDVFPHIVNEDEHGYLSVDYPKLTPILIEAIKEQQRIIEKLKEENLTQEVKIETLEKSLALVEELEKRMRALEINQKANRRNVDME